MVDYRPTQKMRGKSPSNSDYCVSFLDSSITGNLLMRSDSAIHEYYREDAAVKDGPNKLCHPNPTALVGNWLTDKGKVVEVVKAR